VEQFEELVERHRGELFAHSYRMLGSVQDAEDALQEALIGAWQGAEGFEGRSSARTWLFTITTNACLRLLSKRSARMLSFEFGPACTDPTDLGEPVTGPVWVEPFPDDPATAYLRRESVELAFVAALQHLPGTQRAVLILRDVLGFSAAETAEILETTPASVNSAMQRAKATMRAPARTQQDELGALGDDKQQLVDAFVAAWERADVDGLLELLTEDARFTMPPLPAWFDGRENIRRFLVERMFATPWRLEPIAVNGQLAFACYQHDGDWLLGGIAVLTVRDRKVSWVASFLDPALTWRFADPEKYVGADR
jgi:RNA polymerase sigma-70 factor (ECF subfamily)